MSHTMPMTVVIMGDTLTLLPGLLQAALIILESLPNGLQALLVLFNKSPRKIGSRWVAANDTVSPEMKNIRFAVQYDRVRHRADAKHRSQPMQCVSRLIWNA